MRKKVQAYTFGICLGSTYTDNKIFKLPALRKKELLQEEIIGIKNYKSELEEAAMKKLWFILSVLFIVLTFAGAGYVLFNVGKVNAGYACVPMVFALTFLSFYRKHK